MHPRVCLYLLVLGLSLPLRAAPPALDLRVLIDTSSRFAELDPGGNRAEALRLLAGLMPDGAAGGAWTYGRYVEQIAPPGRVDAAWRERMLAGAERIHANAGLADLEHALERSLAGWRAPTGATRRVLLLISASGVQPAGDEQKHAASRQRVADNILDAHAAGVELHAVAIGARADRGLFERLARATGGSALYLHDTRDLPARILDLYARAARPNQLALVDGAFTVDSHVDALTLVLLRPAGSKAPLLIPPDSPVLSAAKPRGARWQASRDFEVVELERPPAGDWQIVGEIAGDSRLFMTGKLELRAGVAPPHAWPGEPLEIAAELFRGGTRIRRNAILRFVEFAVTITARDAETTRLPLHHTEVRADKGRYLLTLDEPLAEGRHRLLVEARGSGFHRLQELDAEIAWPVEIRIEAAVLPGQYDLRLRAREAQLRADGLAADVEVESPKGKREALLLQAESGWLRGRIVTGIDGVHQARVRVSGRRHDGSLVDLNLGPFALLGAASQAEAGLAAPPPPEPATAEPAGLDRKLIGIVILTGNGSLLLAILGVWLYLRRKRRLALADGHDETPAAETDGSAIAADSGNDAVVAPEPFAEDGTSSSDGDDTGGETGAPAPAATGTERKTA